MRGAGGDAGTPRLEDLSSVVMTHAAGDPFNPPALTNFWGVLQAARCVAGIQHLAFPPYSCGDLPIGALTVNGVCFQAGGVPVDHRWRPDRIERSARAGILRVSSVTAMGVAERTVAVRVEVSNPSGSSQPVSLRFATSPGVVSSLDGWRTPASPRERPEMSHKPWEGSSDGARQGNRRELLPGRAGVLFSSSTSRAFCLQAVVPAPARIERRWLDLSFRLPPRSRRTVHLLVAVGPHPEELTGRLAAFRRDPDAFFARAERDWREEISAVFTPPGNGNARFSGFLPRLATKSRALRAVYHGGILSAVYFKRQPPESRYGRTYTTLMPRYWATTSFINDWSLSADVLAALDPECLRRHVEMWLERDIYSHFGTEYVSGENAGNWYSCNDYAMTRLASAYLRQTGDWGWLDAKPGGKSGRTVAGHLLSIALHYRSLDRGHGLADYGERNNLLECVNTYQHEVASLSAAQVWALRETARILERRGDAATAGELRGHAKALVPEIQKLYVKGKGWWRCRYPDGTTVETRHSWDLVHALNFLRGDLPPRQVREMIAFFERELMTPAWMHALSPLDSDVDFSLRPDHEWNGSYPAWVALAATGLARAGRHDLLARWLPGLGASAGQGPYSQAHFVESYARPERGGGALKAPTEWPYINDWAILAAGSFYETVVSGIFGVELGLDALAAKPALGRYDRSAVLDGLAWQGRRYRVDAKGARELA